MADLDSLTTDAQTIQNETLPAANTHNRIGGWLLNLLAVLQSNFETLTGSQSKANNAQAAAISTAATDATTKANNAQDAAISAAATDATTKANNAQDAAIFAAATDATTKANNAQAAAISAAADNIAVYNCNVGDGVDLIAIPDESKRYYFSLQTARDSVPAGVRKNGLKITFKNAASSWQNYQYVGPSDLSGWDIDANWIEFATTADTQYNIEAISSESSRAQTAEALLQSNINNLILIPSGMQVAASQQITLGNLVAQPIIATIQPETAIKSVLFLGDENAVTVSPDGCLTPKALGQSKIHVIPAMAANLYQTITVTVVQGMRITATGGLRLTSSGGFRLT